MLRLALRTSVQKLQSPSKLTYQHGLLRFSQLRPFHASTRTYSSVGHSSINDGIANLKARMTNIETEVKNVKTEMKQFNHKIDTLGMKFEASLKQVAHDLQTNLKQVVHDLQANQMQVVHDLQTSQKELAHSLQLSLQKKLDGYMHDQREQFINFYAFAFFGILGISALIVAGAWTFPLTESTRLDVEIKKSAIIRDGVDKMLQRT